VVSGIILIEGGVPARGDVEHIIRSLNAASVLDIVVVFGRGSNEVSNELKTWFRGKCIVDETASPDSLQRIPKGFAALDQTDLHGAIVCTVTEPLISQEIVVDLLHAFWTCQRKIIVAATERSGTTPIILDRSIIEGIEHDEVHMKLEKFISLRAEETIEVPVRVAPVTEGG